MIQLRIRGKDDFSSHIPYFHAEVNIIKRHAEAFIKASHCPEITGIHKHTGSCHCADLLNAYHSAEISCILSGRPAHHMACNTSQPQNNSCMLDGVIRIIQLGSHNGNLLLLADSKHFLHPVRGQDLHIIVQKQKIFSLCLLCGKIIYGRIIKLFFPHKNSYPWVTLMKLLIIGKGFFFLTVVFYH